MVWKRLVLVAVLAGTMGCAATAWYGNPLHPTSKTLSVGMTKSQVQSLLGPPQQAFVRHFNSIMIETWTYMDQTLTFQSGVLRSWVENPSTP